MMWRRRSRSRGSRGRFSDLTSSCRTSSTSHRRLPAREGFAPPPAMERFPSSMPETSPQWRRPPSRPLDMRVRNTSSRARRRWATATSPESSGRRSADPWSTLQSRPRKLGNGSSARVPLCGRSTACSRCPHISVQGVPRPKSRRPSRKSWVGRPGLSLGSSRTTHRCSGSGRGTTMGRCAAGERLSPRSTVAQTILMAIPQPSEGTLFAASMEVRHDCVVGNLSRKFPGVRIFHWCVNDRDVLQASGRDAELDAFRDAVVSSFGGRQVYATGDGIIMVTEAHMCSTVKTRTVTSIIASAGVWDIPPVVYREGWESWRVIAWSDQSLREMFREIRKIGELRIVSMRPIENLQMEKMMLMPASDTFTGLTSKQSDAVLLGLRHGYYTLPSGTDIQRLADGAGLSSSTLSEDLRKAEARVLHKRRPYPEAAALRGA